MLTINQILADSYVVEEQIGKGGFGSVYRARELYTPAPRYVALKCLPVESGTIAGRQNMAAMLIKREMRMLKSLHHPGLVQVYELLRYNGSPVMVMEYVPGWSFEQVLDRVGACSEDLVIHLGIALCTVLDYLHSQKQPVIFRDLKPGNIMVRHQKYDELRLDDFDYPEHLSFKLIDFGIARTFKPEQNHDTELIGTPDYMAPEVRKGRQTDARSDVYSLGMTMLCVLAGRRPETGIPSLWKQVSHVSDGLVQIIDRATSYYHSDRYDSARSMCADLQALVVPKARAVGDGKRVPGPPRKTPVGNSVVPVRPSVPPLVRHRTRPRPRRRVVLLSSVLTLIAVGATSSVVYQTARIFEESVVDVRIDIPTRTLPTPTPVSVPTAVPAVSWLVPGAKGTLYFCQQQGNGPLYDIYRVRLDGSQPERLTTDGNNFALTVSANGKTMAFSKRVSVNKEAYIYVGPTDSVSFAKMDMPRSYAHFPALSPDGTQMMLGLTNDRAYPFDLYWYTGNISGTLDMQISDVEAIRWGANGDVVYAAASSVGNAPRDIYLRRSDGTTEQITNTPTFDESYPSLSHTGNSLTFVQSASRQKADIGQISALDLTKPPSVRVPISLTRNMSSNPVWSPDGSWIAYVTKPDRASSWRLWVMRADGREAQPISPADGGEIFYLSWVP